MTHIQTYKERDMVRYQERDIYCDIQRDRHRKTQAEILRNRLTDKF